ncbi:uncharacterized protein EI97DRAFT_504755 [Westerdykella ornata]|uniref:Rhodopsin domain-containing protein n=1 Tax=Westerdykella ornata TaxID=318751 RepID=A0A6A6J6K5_WESOR|nr:uncharacterized protein EI97DRAFT_504755 [Westerdykella ornata]KAF2271773.1 hypothetical protein EI97DRAFT_504755 [Westerdykella ornata]
MFAPVDLGPTIRITAFTLTAFSTLVVAVRFYCRLSVVGKLKSYDYIMMASVLCTWGLCVENHYQLLTGSGVRFPPGWKPTGVTTPEINRVLRIAAISWFAYRMTYVITLGLIKISILVFYLSFATSRTFRRLVLLSLAIVSVFTVVTAFLNGFECPYNPSVTLDQRIFFPKYSSRCLKRPVLYFSQAAFNMFSDAAILILPMPSLFRLRMPTPKRASLIAVFSAGLLVPIASGFRIWALYVWATGGQDGRYKGAYMMFWGQVEINTAIVCASAPSLQPIFKRLFRILASYRTHSAFYDYGEGSPPRTELAPPPRRRVQSTFMSTLELPSPTYQVNSPPMSTAAERRVVIVQKTDIGEETRREVRHFASNSTLGDLNEAKVVAKPREILPYG